MSTHPYYDRVSETDVQTAYDLQQYGFSWGALRARVRCLLRHFHRHAHRFSPQLDLFLRVGRFIPGMYWMSWSSRA